MCPKVKYIKSHTFRSTKIGEVSDKSKCFENVVFQAPGVLARIYAAELMDYNILLTIHPLSSLYHSEFKPPHHMC